MAPVTSAGDGLSFCNNSIHPYVVTICRKISVNQLKIVTQSDQMCRVVVTMQEPIIESFAVADPVAGEIEGDSRHNDQIGFVRQMIRS